MGSGSSSKYPSIGGLDEIICQMGGFGRRRRLLGSAVVYAPQSGCRRGLQHKAITVTRLYTAPDGQSHAAGD
jgi:hypothetical protein